MKMENKDQEEADTSLPQAETIQPVNGRAVTNLQSPIPSGSFLVFYFVARDRVRCDRDGQYLTGSNEAGRLFVSREDAEAFARSVIDSNHKIGSGIYNSSWQVLAEWVHDDFLQQQARVNSPSRLLLWAGLLLVGGSAFLWFEVHSGWTLMFGFLIGTRLLLAGFVRLGKGLLRIKRGS